MASLAREDWDRKAPVWFGSSVEALPTSPGDIWGWLNDHYLEHVRRSMTSIRNGSPPALDNCERGHSRDACSRFCSSSGWIPRSIGSGATGAPARAGALEALEGRAGQLDSQIASGRPFSTDVSTRQRRLDFEVDTLVQKSKPNRVAFTPGS